MRRSWKSSSFATASRPTLTPRVWIDLHEQGGAYLDQGPGKGLAGYPGATRSEISRRFPDFDLPEELSEEGWWGREYEDPPASAGRAIRVAKTLLQRPESPERVALITHGNFIDLLLKALLGQLPRQHLYFRHYNTAFSRCVVEPGKAIEVRSINQVGHLPPELVS